MAPRPIGFALLGFAHGHQNTWAQAAMNDSRARVIGAWDVDRDRGRRSAEKLGVEFVPNLADLLARGDVDATTVCAENHERAGLAVAAANAGKHVLVQRPMATTLTDCDRVVEAVERVGVKYMLGHSLRFDPIILAIKEMVDSGVIGSVSMVRRRHAHHHGLTPDGRDRVLGFMADPVRAGGGALMDEGAPVAPWFVWMFGAPLSVTAVVNTRVPELQVDDNAAVIYQFANKVIGIHQSSWTVVAGDPTTMEIYGDAGTIVQTGTDTASNQPAGAMSGVRRLKVFTTAKGIWEYPEVQPAANGLALNVTAFLDSIAGNTESPTPVRVARTAVEMILAAYQSAREGRTVALPLAR